MRRHVSFLKYLIFNKTRFSDRTVKYEYFCKFIMLWNRHPFALKLLKYSNNHKIYLWEKATWKFYHSRFGFLDLKSKKKPKSAFFTLFNIRSLERYLVYLFILLHYFSVLLDRNPRQDWHRHLFVIVIIPIPDNVGVSH
jgi:hypothetical protein